MSEHSSFDEERVNEAFRKVRNRLRKHYPEEIILACVKKLNEHPQDGIEHLRMYPAWRLLLLVKWTFTYGDYLSPNRRPLNVRDFNYLLNLMHDLAGCLRTPSEYENIFLFFRNMAFQQFWLQHELNLADFARQSVLFGRLDKGHPFQQRFADRCGMSIPNFIELAMILMTRFTVEKEMSVTTEWFKPVADKYETGTIQRFLDLLSKDFKSLRALLLAKQQRDHKVSYEAYEKTSLREIPLLKHNSKYYPFSAELLARCVETFIYDTLRSDDPEDFMDKFGPIFERYVGSSISNIKMTFFSERELMQTLRGSGKLVDYLLIDKDAKVFIDAKGVEMSYLGMVGHQPGVIKDRTRDSVIRGIQQGFETAKRLEGIDRINGTEIGKSDNYLIVVTFKDLFVGNGADFYEYVAKDTLNRLVSQTGGKVPIPFEHMYFMSIDDFDLLAGGVTKGEMGLVRTLDHAAKADASPQTKKFTFGQHIYDICPKAQPPKWLVDEAKYILDRCSLRFGQIHN